jgi:hypothetical protein
MLYFLFCPPSPEFTSNPEDGGEMFLSNVGGLYRATRPYNQKGRTVYSFFQCAAEDVKGENNLG